MELFIETLVEFVAEFIMEGSFQAATAKKVPLIIRIVAVIILAAVYIGLNFVLVFVGIQSIKDNTAIAVILFAAAAFVDIALAVITIKYCKKRQKNENLPRE